MSEHTAEKDVPYCCVSCRADGWRCPAACGRPCCAEATALAWTPDDVMERGAEEFKRLWPEKWEAWLAWRAEQDDGCLVYDDGTACPDRLPQAVWCAACTRVLPPEGGQ